MTSSIDYTIDQMTELFENLVKNIDTMSLEDFKREKEALRERAHDLFKYDIKRAFLAGSEAELDDTSEEYYYRTYKI